MKPLQPSDLLIAPPRIPDRRFRGCVLVVTHATSSGAFALCVNRTTEHTLKDVIADTGVDPIINYPLYWGGPMSPSTVWMLHSNEWVSDGTVIINNKWAMTSNLEMFKALGTGKCPQHFRLMIGHCSWAPGQLEMELSGEGPWRPEHSWLVTKNPGPAWVMEQEDRLLWETSTTLCSHQAVDSWFN
jgi:putative transcriptional regulator